MSRVEFHDLANLFPMIQGTDFDALVADIKENGLLEKVVTLDGKILDGRNRFRACVAAGLITEEINPNTGMWFVEFNEQNFGADAVEQGPLAFVISKNLNRRHLSESQRAYVAARLADMPNHRPDDKSANLRTSQEEAAKRLNVSVRLVQSAKKVQEKGTASLKAAVEQGILPASAGAQAAALAPEQQDEVARQAEAGRSNVVRNVIKKGARDARETALGQKLLALPDKQYGVILADPEWEFVVWSNITGLDRSAINHYDVSPWEKISARDVQKIAAKDCLLFLWVTDLERGLNVLRAWGFEYKSYFVWTKDIVEGPRDEQGRRTFVEVGAAGTGYWNRDRDEILLVGTKGKVVAPAMGTQGESVWFSARPKIEGTQRGRHSAKPLDAHLWLEQHFPHTPKIELNARQARPGWDVWGYEAPQPKEEPQAPAGPVAPAALTNPEAVYAQALRVVVTEQAASVSLVQRRLTLGYNRAADLVARLECEGLVAYPDHRGKRAVKITAPDAEFTDLLDRACAGDANALAALPGAAAALAALPGAAAALAGQGAAPEPEQPASAGVPTPHRTASNAEVMAEAREIVIRDQKASAAHLQRALSHHHLSQGDVWAILDMLEQQGVVSRMASGGDREVLIDSPAKEAAAAAAPALPPAPETKAEPMEIPEFLRRPPVKLGGE